MPISTVENIFEAEVIQPLNNSFDFKGSDTQYSTHALHTYVAAMVPELAKVLVQTFVPKGERILDPFCGGGAVLVETVRNGNFATERICELPINARTIVECIQ